MIGRTLAALVAATLVIAFLMPVLIKLNEPPLYAIATIGLVMMLIELWESLARDK